MVDVDPLLKMLGDLVDPSAGRQAFFPALGDGWRIRASTIRSDAVWGKQRLGREHFAEESLGCIEIAVGGEEDVDWVAVFVDDPVHPR